VKRFLSPRSGPPRRAAARRPAYTLVEMLMSVALTLIILAFVVQIFGMVGDSVSDARALLEMNDRLRSATERLRKDLKGATAQMTPPLSPEAGLGYFEIIEGPIGPVFRLDQVAFNTDAPNPSPPDYFVDTTVIDKDDVLMLTVRSRDEAFVGRTLVRKLSGMTAVRDSAQSETAEVCWFVRGKKLYRGVRLIQVEFDPDRSTPNTREPLSYSYLYGGAGALTSGIAAGEAGFYNNFDLSVHLEAADLSNMATWVWVPNSLADLTKRENRFAHQPPSGAFPFSPHSNAGWRHLGLPTLRECSWCANPAGLLGAWWPGHPLPDVGLAPLGLAQGNPVFVDDAPPPPFATDKFDAWHYPLPFDPVTITAGAATVTTSLAPDTDAIVAFAGPRVAEDVILTDVVGFDVKVWDPGAPLVEVRGAVLAPGDPGYTISGTVVGYGAYVDLGYAPGYTPPPNAPLPLSNVPGDSGSGLVRVYDTWSTHYEKNGLDDNNNGLVDEGANGFDDDGNGIVDDAGEQEAPPPYARRLRGIQIKVRVIDPDSRQVREVTVTEHFPSR